jgi:8-oxo-dGTP diphosphatase
MSTIYCAFKAVIQEGDRFLVLQQRLPNRTYWDLPGGRLEYGEEPMEALHREVKEETGLNIEIGKPLGVFWFFRDDDAQVVCMTYLCSAPQGTIGLTANPSPEDIVQAKWVTKEEFLNEEYDVAHESLKELIAAQVLSANPR